MFHKILAMLVVVVVAAPFASAADNHDDLYKESNQLRRKGEYQKAVEVAAKLVEHESAPLIRRTTALQSIGYMTFHNIKNREKGIEVYERLCRDFREFDDGYTEHHWMSWVNELADLYRVVGENDKAHQLTDEIINNSNVPDDAFVKCTSYYIKAHTYSSSKKTDDAAKSMLKVFEIWPTSGPASTLVRHNFYHLVSNPETVTALDIDFDRMVSVLYRAIAENSERTDVAEYFQLALARVLHANGEFDDAIYELKMLTKLTTDATRMRQAVEVMSVLLKSVDGGLYRVNKLLDYHKYGPAGPDQEAGTSDDLKDPLAKLSQNLKSERDSAFEKSIAARKLDWKSRLTRAAIYRYWGKPRNSLAELKIAYARCPMDQKNLQLVTDRIVEVLVQLSGDVTIGEAFIAFQKHGPPGPDRKLKTDDDLVNPIDQYLAIESVSSSF